MKAGKKTNILLHIIFIIMSICCLFPLLLVLSISFSSNKSLVEYGYTIIPREFSLEAYKYVLSTPITIIRAYGVTIFNTVFGTFCSTLVIALFAYPLSRNDFKARKFFTYYLLATMLFSGGTVSWYMVCTTMYHLSDKIWAMTVPSLMNAWYVIIMRTFFKTNVPVSIIESGELDGANEYIIFFKLVIPISLPGIATIALFQALYYWNDWWLPIMFIVKPELYNLQFLLQRMMQNIQQLNENALYMSSATDAMVNIPSESARMALCIIVMGPILVVYPFFQKYFIQGLTVGSVKG